MKHAYRYILCLVVGAVALCGCSKQHNIPDDDLEKITHEMFLVNAYASANQINTDSLDIYTPILTKYGYTQDQFFNSLANFQTRKSARFGDIIEHTVTSLDLLAKEYQARVNRKEFIDSLVKAECQEELFYKDTIRVTRMKDTARLRLTIPVPTSGELLVRFNYTVDTLDKNLRLQTNHELHNQEEGRLYVMRSNLTGGGKQKEYKATIVIREESEKYELVLADYKHREKEPNIAFGSIQIIYQPTREEALMRMRDVVRVRPFDPAIDTLFRRNTYAGQIPLLPSDTVWMTADSLLLDTIRVCRSVADSLSAEALKLRKERDEFAEESTKRSITKRRRATIAEKMNTLREQFEALEDEAMLNTQRADSLEEYLFGDYVFPSPKADITTVPTIETTTPNP